MKKEKCARSGCPNIAQSWAKQIFCSKECAPFGNLKDDPKYAIIERQELRKLENRPRSIYDRDSWMEKGR